MPTTWAVVSGANSRSREYPPFCHPLREGPYRIRWWVERHLPSPSTTRKGKVQQWHVDPEVAGSSPALVNFSLFIQIYLKSVPSQFSLWFITWYLYKKVVSLYGASPTACSPGSCIVTWAWSLAKGQYMVSWLLTGAPNKDIDKIGRPPM